MLMGYGNRPRRSCHRRNHQLGLGTESTYPLIRYILHTYHKIIITYNNISTRWYWYRNTLYNTYMHVFQDRSFYVITYYVPIYSSPMLGRTFGWKLWNMGEQSEPLPLPLPLPLSSKMDIDNPGLLKRSNSAPMIPQLNNVTPSTVR